MKWENIHNIPANTSTLIFGWKWKLSRRTFIDVVSTLAKQRWSNIDRITLIQRRWTNVASTLIFGWKWKLSWSIFINVETTLKELSWFNVADPILFQCWYLVEKESWVNICSSALRKQHWKNFVNICCSDVP